MEKWKRFQIWGDSKQVTPTSSSLPLIVDYILDLKKTGLSLSSVKVHLAAITAFHRKIEGYSIFAHPTTKRFLKSMSNLFPQIRHPTSAWDLNLVLKSLTKPPFKPMVTCSLMHLSMKTAFLVAITLAQRIARIGALMVHPPFTIFLKDKVTLRPHPKFFPKVALTFHINQLIPLPTFFWKPHRDNAEAVFHTLYVKRTLAFYLDRTKHFRKIS